jgi:hypothetical protein
LKQEEDRKIKKKCSLGFRVRHAKEIQNTFFELTIISHHLGMERGEILALVVTY